MMRIPLIAVVVLGLSACAKRQDDPSMGLGDVRALEGVPPRYRPIYEGVFGYRDDDARAVLPFESITLERTGCFGSCPAYKVTFFRSGEACLEAYAHMPLKGVFKGKIDVRQFARLCFAIERLGFAGFKSDYRAPWTDDASCIVTVASSKSRKSVSDYGAVGPIELWTIQSALDRVRQDLRWVPSKEEPNSESSVSQQPTQDSG